MRKLINDAEIYYKDLDGLVYGLLVIAINNISEVKNDQSFNTLFDFFVNGFGLEESLGISFNSTSYKSIQLGSVVMPETQFLSLCIKECQHSRTG